MFCLFISNLVKRPWVCFLCVRVANFNKVEHIVNVLLGNNCTYKCYELHTYSAWTAENPGNPVYLMYFQNRKLVNWKPRTLSFIVSFWGYCPFSGNFSDIWLRIHIALVLFLISNPEMFAYNSRFATCSCHACNMVDKRRTLNNAIQKKTPQTNSQDEYGPDGKKQRKPNCAFCKGHGILAPLKGPQKEVWHSVPTHCEMVSLKSVAHLNKILKLEFLYLTLGFCSFIWLKLYFSAKLLGNDSIWWLSRSNFADVRWVHFVHTFASHLPESNCPQNFGRNRFHFVPTYHAVCTSVFCCAFVQK